MAKKKTKIEKAFDIIRNYKGTNNQIIAYKHLIEGDKMLLTEDGFQTEYIINNADYEPIEVNKIINISDILGTSLMEKYKLDFVPQKLKICRIIGEMGNSYHCYCQYRKSVPQQLMYIRKNLLLNPIEDVDYTTIDVDFSKYDNLTKVSGRKLKEHQKSAIQFLLKNRKCILADGMGLGKMQPNSSLIATPDGFKKMGDINVGDKVFGSDGKPCDVLEVFPHKNKEIYRVKFNDGTFAECGKEHLWVVRRKLSDEWTVKSLEEMIEEGFIMETPNLERPYVYQVFNYEIPTTKPVEYNAKKHLIPPYIVGICMCSNAHPKHKCNCPEKNYLGEKLDQLLNQEVINNGISYSSFQEEMKRLDLEVEDENKSIPDEYKIDSVENRFALLQGLMDNSGYLSMTNIGYECYYYTFSEKLAYDVQELVTSLGGAAEVKIYIDEVGFKTKKHFTVLIHIDRNPFSLERKRNEFDKIEKGYFRKSIIGVEYVRKEDAKCLLVNSPDHTYITGREHIVTHNTTSSIVAAMESGSKKILVVTTASLKSTWKREICLYEKEEDIVVVNGSKWDGETGKWTVVNYDILQNYYEIPLEPEYEIKIIDNGNGEVEEFRVPVMIKDKTTGMLKPKMVKSRKKDKITESLKNSPLYTSNFDCIIIDEAQKLSNNTSNRYKVLYDYLTKANLPYVFLTTGTPLTNTPMNLYNILKLIKADITSDYEFYIKRYCDGKTIFKNGEWKKWSDIYDRNRGYKSLNTDKNKYEFIESHAKKITIPQGATNLDELRERIKHLYIRRLSSDIPGMVNKYVDTRYYDLTSEQKEKYDNLWDEYIKAQEENGDNTNEEYRQLVEGTIVRQYLANEMVNNTIKLADEYIEDDEKVVIVCNFTSEIDAFKKYYGKMSVVYDGKMTAKQKDKAEHEFMTNPKIKVFIGQIESAGVGLTLTESRIMIFNSYSWLETSNRQMQDRIYRITQTRDATCIYQLFTDSISQDMFEKVMRKGLIMDTTITDEKNKK